MYAYKGLCMKFQPRAHAEENMGCGHAVIAFLKFIKLNILHFTGKDREPSRRGERYNKQANKSWHISKNCGIKGKNRSVFILQVHFGYNSVQLGITWYNSVQLSTTPFNSVLKPNKTELYQVITWYNFV